MSINTTELPSLRQLDINATDAFVVNSSTSSAPITEDIDMVDHNLDDPSHFLADNPASTGQEFDLNQFSITSDSDYNGDIDLTTELQDVLLSKRNDLAQWTKVYRQSMLRVAKTPTDHSLYATWQHECEDLANIVRQKEKEHDSFAAAMSLGSLATESILSPTSAVIAAAKVDNKKLSLDLGTPRFGDAKHGKGQPFQVIRDPHLFLDSFKTYCENSYGETPFLASAQRLLCMAILDEQTRQQFNDELSRHGSSSLTWEECEVAFVDSVLTPKERFLTVARVAETGRRNKESYRNFALRLQRSVRVYRIDDSNATVLSGIMGSIPSLELNLIKNSIQKAGTSLSDVRLNSITELLTALSVMEGPDDSLKRPHSLVDDDEDDKKDASSSKTSNGNHNGRKRLRHRKNDRGSKGKANADSSPSSSLSDSGKKTFHCDNHGDNYTHDTKNCRHCTKCNKKGHTAPYCNSDRKKNADSKGGKSYKDKREGKLFMPPFSELVTLPTPAQTLLTHATISLQASEPTDSEEMTDRSREEPPPSPTIVEPSIKKLPLSGSNTIPLGPILSPSLAVYASSTEENNVSVIPENVVTVTTKNNVSDAPSSDSEQSVTTDMGEPALPSARPQYAFRSSPPKQPVLVSVPYFETKEPTFASLSNFATCSQEGKAQQQEDDNDFGMMTEELDAFASDKLNLRHYAAIKDAVEHDNRFRIEIRAFKRTYHALIDTGATHSFIRQDVVKEHNIPFTKIVGNFSLANKSVVERIGVTDQVEFEFNSRFLSAPFEIIEDQEFPLTVGMDLFYHMGFALFGLPEIKEMAPTHDIPVEDEKPSLRPTFPQKLWTDRPKLKTPMKVYGYIHMLKDKSVPRITVAAKDRPSLMTEVHSLGHIGANKMVDKIHAQDKTWPFMVKDCLEHVKKCPECQRINITRKGYHPLKAIHAHLPGEHMTVDLAGEFHLSSKNNKYLLVLTDLPLLQPRCLTFLL
ncbi:MAG: hypothetical protein JOS17DRAFT_778170 [Linnemannia elongata]|nr:MAG: hypothetical protein JOS17DRAFT_778170 [Linnemannia elongata]